MAFDSTIFVNGGVGLFSGSEDPIKAGLGWAILAKIIASATGSRFLELSHCGVFLPQKFWRDPQMPELSQSTIYQGVNGPQRTPLFPWLNAEYGNGGHAWIYTFKPQFTPDWDALNAYQQQQYALVAQGKAHYAILRLVADLVDRDAILKALPLLGLAELIADDNLNDVVCSEHLGDSLVAGAVDQKAKAANLSWLPTSKPVAGQVVGSAPQDYINGDMDHLYADKISIL